MNAGNKKLCFFQKLLIPKLHAAKPGKQAEREPAFDLGEEGGNKRQFRFFDFVGCVILGAVEIC